MKIWYTALWAASVLLLACKGQDNNDNHPVPPKPPVTTYGFFRALQPKLFSIAQPLKLSVGASTNNPSVTMATPRSGHKAIAIGGGKFMIIGGEGVVPYAGLPDITSVIDIFDSASETFTKSDTPTNLFRYWRSDGRYNFSLVPIPGDKILITGGSDNISCIEIFDPSSNTIVWKNQKTFDQPVNNVGPAFYMGDNKVLFIGTWLVTETEVIQRGNAVLDLNTFTASFIDTPQQVWRNSAVQLPDGSVVYAGGEDVNLLSHKEIWKVDTSFNTTQVGTLLVARQDYGMTLLSDGNIGVYGGITRTVTNDVIRLKSVEIINPTTWVSTSKVDMLFSRSFTLATQLQTGYVLNAGGSDETGSVASDELVHNHLLNISGTTGNLNIPRLFYSVVPLNNGRLLISGGITDNKGSITNQAEIYDPAAKVLVSYDTSTTITINSTVHFTSTNTVVWSVSPVHKNNDPGVITADGVYTAPNVSTEVVVTATDGTNKASVTLHVIE